MWWHHSSTATHGVPQHGRITDRRTTPAGVVPRHLQHWVLVGVALVMVGILALSGGPATPRATTPSSSDAPIVDPNQQRIEEYQRRIQEQAQRLAAEQAQLQLAKDAVTTGAAAAPVSSGAAEGNRRPVPAAATPDRATREEHARFADNVAFSKPLSTAGSATEPSAGTTSVPAAQALTIQNLPPLFSAPAPTPPPMLAATTTAAPAPANPVAPAPRAERPSPSTGEEPRYRLFEGTVIDTVLTNRLDGTFSGPVNCLVSVPVYAADHLVIPAGSRVLGDATAVNTFGQSRLAVVFHRVILPNGTTIDLNGFHGLNQVGDLGLRDQVDRHYAQLFGVSLALGALAGFAQAQSSAGLDATGLDVYRQGVAANVSQSSARILDRFLNILPTVTIREGHRIKVYLSNDLELPAYREPPLPTGGRP